MNDEIARWQEAIHNLCREHYPEVDGSGCESGDELDFSLVEIKLTLVHIINKEDNRIIALETETKRLNDLMSYHDLRESDLSDKIVELAREAERFRDQKDKIKTDYDTLNQIAGRQSDRIKLMEEILDMTLKALNGEILSDPLHSAVEKIIKVLGRK